MKIKSAFLLLCAVSLLAGCSKDGTPAGKQNEWLLSATASGVVPKELLQVALASEPDYAPYAALMKTNVTFYRVSYLTQYPQGKKITASGIFIIPDDCNANYPAVVYTHGSLVKSDAPSRHINTLRSCTFEVLLGAVVCSSFNCAVIMPDYVGYGDSEAIAHPYIHGESLGQASLDLIEAFREYAASPKAPISPA